MKEIFKLWSSIKQDAMTELHPDLGLRDWDDLTDEEKRKIWRYLRYYFLNGEFDTRIFVTIIELNENHKYRSYGENFLRESTSGSAKIDFESIFLHQSQNVVLELLSGYAKTILDEKADKPFYRRDVWTDEEYKRQKIEWQYEELDKYAYRLNDIFEHFGINVILTRHGFIPTQDTHIVQEIYRPVLNFLINDEWEHVNRDLKDAFKDYQLKTDVGYSSCITHSISAVEAYLQILIYGQTGKGGSLNGLVSEAQKRGLIPNDIFSNKIIEGLVSIIARERINKSDAHPKQEYANERNARLILNLSMVFLQHCIQSK